MIQTAIELIGLDDWLGVSKNIEVAKGKFEMKTTLKQGFKQLKRDIEWQRK
jgi:hypothetical protein